MSTLQKGTKSATLFSLVARTSNREWGKAHFCSHNLEHAENPNAHSKHCLLSVGQALSLVLCSSIDTIVSVKTMWMTLNIHFLHGEGGKCLSLQNAPFNPGFPSRLSRCQSLCFSLLYIAIGEEATLPMTVAQRGRSMVK